MFLYIGKYYKSSSIEILNRMATLFTEDSKAQVLIEYHLAVAMKFYSP